MKNSLLLFLLLSQAILPAQVVPIGNLGVGITSDGSLFRSSSNQMLLEAPFSSGLTTIYESHLWVGYVKNGVKHAIMPLFTSPVLGNSKTYGPYFDQGSYNPLQSSALFNKTYSVRRDTALNHRANYATLGYVTPSAISSYVAVGDTAKGVHPELLPFEAIANDGLYLPQRGDIPVTSGRKSRYALYSDRGVAKLNGNAPTLLNVSVELYEHDLSVQSDAHANTVFAKFRVTNTGTEPIDSLFVGLVADFDIGQPENDYVGTDSVRNFIYGFNYATPEPADGYGFAPPAMAVMPLGQPIARSMRYDPGITQPNPQSTPINLNQQFGYLKGIAPNGTVLPKYYAPGDPITKQGVLDDTLSQNFLDRAMILAMPTQSLAANSTACYDFAYVFAQGLTRIGSFERLREYCDEIRLAFDSTGSTCSIAQFLGAPSSELPTIKVMPNPVLDYASIELGTQTAGGRIHLVNQQGQVLIATEFAEGEEFVRLNLSELSQGVYFLEVLTSEHRVVEKIVKS
jgi:hypothetical protein